MKSRLIAVLAWLLFVPAGAHASATDDASDKRVGSRALAVPGPGPLLIDRPGDRDWYLEPGREVGAYGTAYISVAVEGGTGCTSPRPLRIGFHNPEGAWIRTFTFAPGDGGQIRVPELPGNYFINVSATDPGCSGLSYTLSHVGKGEPRVAGRTECDEKAAARTQARQLLDSLRRRRDRVTGAARLRYEAYVNTARSQLAAARRQATRACRSPAPRERAKPEGEGEGGGGGGGGG